MGVTSRMTLTENPAACRERRADSRPAPGPLTCTWTDRIPASAAFRAALSAAIWAANGVPLREPLKPTLPALAHATEFPCGSVIVTIVLLKVEWIWTTPSGTDRFIRFLRADARSPALAIPIYSLHTVPKRIQTVAKDHLKRTLFSTSPQHAFSVSEPAFSQRRYVLVLCAYVRLFWFAGHGLVDSCDAERLGMRQYQYIF